jgi:plasmid stability protein
MKNVTVSLDEETYRNARMRAAERGTSVSALVRRFLTELGSTETDFQRRKRRESELRQRVPTGFRAADILTRDQVHERGT